MMRLVARLLTAGQAMWLLLNPEFHIARENIVSVCLCLIILSRTEYRVRQILPVRICKTQQSQTLIRKFMFRETQLLPIILSALITDIELENCFPKRPQILLVPLVNSIDSELKLRGCLKRTAFFIVTKKPNPDAKALSRFCVS